MARIRTLLAVCAAGAALAWQLPEHTPAPHAPAIVAAPTPATVAAVPAAAPAAATTATGVAAAPDAEQLLLPDGTSVPALNGAIGPPPLLRALGDRAFAPIVGVERSPAGIDWYVHADGARSTTEMRWRPDLGRFDALTRMAQPIEGTAPPVR